MPRNSTLTPEKRAELVRIAEQLPAGRRAAFAKEQAQLIGCHPATVYRAIEEASSVRARKRRSDAGSLKAVDQETFLDLAALTRRIGYDAETAIDVLNANRQVLGLPLVDISPATLRRQLAARDLSNRQRDRDLRVHRRWEAPYSGHTHQIDSTVAHCYYIDRDNSIGHETREVLNKNKAGNGKPRVWMIGMVEDYARVKWARFYTSEAANSWRDLMLRAWAKPADTSLWPAYGLPEHVYSDCGSGLRSLENQRMLDDLGVKYDMAKPSTEFETNAQAKGKIESAIKLVQGFELFTKHQRFEALEEMNLYFEKYLLWLNRRRHSTTAQSPFHRWLAGMQDRALRLLPPPAVLARFEFVPTTRNVNKDMTIQLEGTAYQLPMREPFISFSQQKVPVLYRRHDLSRIVVVLDGQEHEIDAVIAAPDVAGDFKAAPTPASVELRRELQKRDISHIDPHLVHDYRLAKTAETFAARLPEVEHPLAAAAAAVRMVTRGKAIDRLVRHGLFEAPLGAQERARVDALFAGQAEIPEPALEQWISAQGEDQPHPRLAILSA